MCSSWAGKFANPQLINPGKKVGNTHVLGSLHTPWVRQHPRFFALPIPSCSLALQKIPLPSSRTEDARARPWSLALPCPTLLPNPASTPCSQGVPSPSPFILSQRLHVLLQPPRLPALPPGAGRQDGGLPLHFYRSIL